LLSLPRKRHIRYLFASFSIAPQSASRFNPHRVLAAPSCPAVPSNTFFAHRRGSAGYPQCTVLGRAAGLKTLCAMSCSGLCRVMQELLQTRSKLIMVAVLSAIILTSCAQSIVLSHSIGRFDCTRSAYRNPLSACRLLPRRTGGRQDRKRQFSTVRGLSRSSGRRNLIAPRADHRRRSGAHRQGFSNNLVYESASSSSKKHSRIQAQPARAVGRACRYPLVVEMLPCPSVA
jgi:hypothetical protein